MTASLNYDLFQSCIVDQTNNYKNQASIGSFGFLCSELYCLDWDIWCNGEQRKSDPSLISVCPELIALIQNQQLCSNLTFWMDKKCNNNYGRCRSNLPGQCAFATGKKWYYGEEVDDESNDYQLEDYFLDDGNKLYESTAPLCNDKSDYILNGIPCSEEPFLKYCKNTTFCIHQDLVCDGRINCQVSDKYHKQHFYCYKTQKLDPLNI